MNEYQGHELARRDDDQWMGSSLEWGGGWLPEGRQTASYLGVWLWGFAAVGVVAVLGILGISMGY